MKKRSLISRFIRRLPLPLLAILIGLLLGSGVWVLVDKFQTRKIQKFFEGELHQRVEQQARESLVRFNHLVDQYVSIGQLLAQHKTLAQYLNPLYWGNDELYFKLTYTTESPDWLPGALVWQSLSAPSHIVLIDRYGEIREDYQLENHSMPAELKDLLKWENGISENYLTEVAGFPYLIVTEQIADESDYVMGALVLVVPIDEKFLAASQRGFDSDGTIVALLKSDDHEVLVSSDHRVMPPMSNSSELSDFVVTAQSFVKSSDSVFNLLFATFIPRANTEATIQRVLEIERKQRWIGAVVFILMFSLLFVLISMRLNRVLRRISDFARRALGMPELTVKRGNQLLILEDWMRDFSKLILIARNEMKEQHEDEIRQSEALKSAIMDSSLDSIITVDERGVIIDFNPTAEKIFGHPADEAIGQVIEPLIIAKQCYPHFRSSLENCLKVPVDNSSESRFEMTAVRRDGSEFPVEFSIKPLLLKDHILFTVYMHDISMRKRQELEIRSLAEFPRESPMPILRANQRGVIIYANPPSKVLLNYWGVECLQTLPLYWRKQVEEVLESGEEKEIEVADNEHYYQILLAPVTELQYVNIYGRDVTETRQAEAQARQHQTELVHVCRHSTMGEMATGIAHELNQPLAAIMNYAQGSSRRLKLQLGSAEELLPVFDKIAVQAHRAGEIIKRMRGMLEKQPSIRDEVDLNHLVVEVCSFVEFETHKEDVSIELELSSRKLPARVDLVQIEQVLLNIVRNALDALHSLPEENRRLLIRTGMNEKGRGLIIVEDNGPGIPAPIMEKLFDPFFTTKKTGMGMGLAISQTIIDDHQGKILVESWQDKGSSFTIELPLTTGK